MPRQSAPGRPPLLGFRRLGQQGTALFAARDKLQISPRWEKAMLCSSSTPTRFGRILSCSALLPLLIVLACGSEDDEKVMQNQLREIDSTLGRLEKSVAAIGADVKKLGEDLGELRSGRGSPTALQPATSAEALRVLRPTWVQKGKAVQAFDGQVLVRIEGATGNTASVKLFMPDGEEVSWPAVQVGSRQLLTYEDAVHFFEVLDLDPLVGVQIAITRRQGE